MVSNHLFYQLFHPHRKQWGIQSLLVNCESHLKEQAKLLLKKLKKDYESGKTFSNGEEQAFGWSKLVSHKRKSEVVVCEPDFWEIHSIT